MGSILEALGISADGRVATFGWNTARHLELYFAAPCTGRVLHTLNIRLFTEQLTYIVNHAEDEIIFVDRSLAALLFPLLPTFTTVKHLVLMDDGKGDVPDANGIPVHDYEALLADAAPAGFHVGDENQAASMCYTSGTTGNPKGVVYSHRSTFLHTLGALLADGIGVREADRVLPVVPMFHANAWGLAHAAVACGADLVMPGPDLSPPSIANLVVDERVTVAAGVPTIWMGALPELAGRDTSALRAILCGGSAVPKALSEAYREQIGLPILQAWGMTETSPVASIGWTKSTLKDRPESELADLRAPLRAWPIPAWRSASWTPRRAIPCPGTGSSRVSCSAGATGSRRPTTTTSGRRRASPPTAGCAPATWPPSTARATSAWSTARRT